MTEMPRLIRPMLAKLEHALPPDDDRYGWEFKWDGVRAVVYIDGGQVRLMSRNDKDMAASYPEFAGLSDVVPGPAILDGEIVALRDGRPDFELLQSRMHVGAPAPSLLASAPVRIHVFDVLYRDGELLLNLPYTERRARLEELGLDEGPVRTPPWFQGEAQRIHDESVAYGLEGVVGKLLTSRYQPGVRGWIKVKNVRHQEVIICGWTTGTGRRSGTIGSLLLGVHDDDGRLVYAGHVGTGFTDAMLDELMGELAPLARGTSPFAAPVPAAHARGARWTEPRLVGEVAFAEWTEDGSLRHPSWRGLRPDKEPGDVVIER